VDAKCLAQIFLVDAEDAAVCLAATVIALDDDRRLVSEARDGGPSDQR